MGLCVWDFGLGCFVWLLRKLGKISESKGFDACVFFISESNFSDFCEGLID